jgi:hypothetical protein
LALGDFGDRPNPVAAVGAPKRINALDPAQQPRPIDDPTGRMLDGQQLAHG